jgi:hypothetical protein
MLGPMRSGRVLALGVAMMLGCNSVPAKPPKRPGNTVRYRLLLRDNPVSPRDAMHCFSECQSAATPNAYVDCLSACPGFESTPGEYCSKSEVPPEAACLTVRKIPASAEVPPGMIVLAIVGQMALVVGAVSLCSVSSSQCGLYPPPGR